MNSFHAPHYLSVIHTRFFGSHFPRNAAGVYPAACASVSWVRFPPVNAPLPVFLYSNNRLSCGWNSPYLFFMLLQALAFITVSIWHSRNVAAEFTALFSEDGCHGRPNIP